MNVAGPSRRVRPSGGLATRERVESTYEDDLMTLLDHLGLDEIDEMETVFTHRTRVGAPLSDHDIAMNDLLQQARALATLNEDRILAQRIAAAGEDGVGVGPQRLLAVQAPRVPVAPRPNGNGTMAQRNENRQPARNNTAPTQTWGQWFASTVAQLFIPQLVSQSGPRITPNTSASNRLTGHDCVICQDPIRGVEIRAPCSHYYDIGCITDLFQSATRDETLYPPRCCRQNIPFAQVRPHLSQALNTTFREKEAEFSTLKRVYCSSPTCSRFLGPLSEGIFASKVYTCPAPNCGRRTCGKCREQHTSDWLHTCRPDADAAQVLELSRASGWARCPGCSQMIELNVGCFHMTCRCRTEFCYLCRARWKTCRCPQWDERRLLAVAEERVDAQLGEGRNRAVPRGMPPQQARPPPVPARHPYVPAIPQRQAPAAAPTAAPARTVAPARPVAQVPTPRLQPTPARTGQTASGSVARPTSIASTTTSGWKPRGLASTPAGSTSAAAASSSRLTSSSASASSSASSASPSGKLGWASLISTSVPASARSPAASASAIASSSRLTPTSPSASASTSAGQTRWPKSAVGATDPVRQRLVREMMERLREDHECSHTQWRYRKGAGVCQHCGHRLPLYLFRCQGCEMLACNRCRRNRL